MTDLLRALERNPFFGDFSAQELQDLAQAMQTRRYADGEKLVTEGDRSDALLVIVEGEACLSRRGEDGRSRDLRTVESGEVIGLVGLVENRRRTATATAVGPVQAALLPRSAFTMLYESESPLSVKFQLLIARQLAHDARELSRVLSRAMAASV